MSAETSWEIFLPDYLPPGLNGRKGQERRHWSTKKRDKERARLLIIASNNSKYEKPLPVFTGHVKATYIRYRTRGVPMDDDNLSASFKDIGDALERLGVVENDRQFLLHPHQELAKFKGTLLRLEVPSAEVPSHAGD